MRYLSLVVIFRSKVVTLLPRFLMVNKLPLAIRIFPQRGSYELEKLCSPSPLQPGQGFSEADVSRRDLDVKFTTLVLPGQTCVLYSFHDVDRKAISRNISVSRRNMRRWVRIRFDLAATSQPHLCHDDMISSSAFSIPISLDDVGENYFWLPFTINTPLNSPLTSDPQLNSPKDLAAGLSRRLPVSGLLASSSVLLAENSVVLTVNNVSHSPPYRLENRTTNMAILVRQNLGKAYRDNQQSWSKVYAAPETLEGHSATKCNENKSIESTSQIDSEDYFIRNEFSRDDFLQENAPNNNLNIGSDDDDDSSLDEDDFDVNSWLLLPPQSWKCYLWDDSQFDKSIELSVQPLRKDMASAKSYDTDTSVKQYVALSGSIYLDKIGPVTTFDFIASSPRLQGKGVTRRKCALGGYIYADGPTRVLVLHEVSPNSPMLPRAFSFTHRQSSVKMCKAHDSNLKTQNYYRDLDMRYSPMTVTNFISPWQHLRRVLDLRIAVCHLQLNLLVEKNVADRAHLDESRILSLAELLSVNFENCIIQLRSLPFSPTLSNSFDSLRPHFLDHKQCDVMCDHIQLDDMRPVAKFPVIFAPVPVDHEAAPGPCALQSTPHVHLRCVWTSDIQVDSDNANGREDDPECSSSRHNHVIHIQEMEALMSDVHLKVDMDLILDVVEHIGQAFQDLSRQNIHECILPKTNRCSKLKDSGAEKDTVQALIGTNDSVVDDEAALLSYEAVRLAFSRTLNRSVSHASNLASTAKAVYIELFHHCSLTVHLEVSISSCLHAL